MKSSFDLPGFQRVVRQDLRLNGGFVATINIVMKVSGVEETLTVVGVSPVVDIKSTSAPDRVHEGDVGGHAGLAHDVQRAGDDARREDGRGSTSAGARLAISRVHDLRRRQPGHADARGAQHQPERPGRTQVFFDYNSFDEVQVKALGNGAEVASPGSTMMGIVKSGGNDFHGRYFGAYENKHLQGNNLDDTLRANGIGRAARCEYYDLSADLGGRVLRDRLWFYGAVLLKQSNEQIESWDGDADDRSHLGEQRDAASVLSPAAGTTG